MSVPHSPLVVSLVVAGLLLGCGSSADQGGAADDTTVRVVLLGADNEPLDYGSAQSFLPWIVLGNACDSLVVLEDGQPSRQLATSIEPDGDGSRWTIELRDDARFHDGEPVTADDVATGLAALAASPGFSSTYAPVADFVVVDDTTLTVELIEPRADLVESVLAAASVIVDDTDGLPRCSGPFALESFDPATGAVLVANDDHWDGRPAIDRLEIRSVPDPVARVNALRSNAADVALDLPPSAVTSVDDAPELAVLDAGIANANPLYFVLNSRVPPLDDPEVRAAIAMAVDRDRLVELVIGDGGEVGNDLFGRGLPGYADLPPRPVDQAAAREVLSDRDVTTLSAVVAELTPGSTAATELLREQLAEVGVGLEIEPLDPSVFFTDLDRLGEAHLFPMFAVNRAPVALLPQLFGDDNPFAFSGWYPDAFADAVRTAQADPDEAVRADALAEVQALQHEQVPHLVWGYRPQRSGVREGIAGIRFSQGIPRFAAATFEPTS